MGSTNEKSNPIKINCLFSFIAHTKFHSNRSWAYFVNGSTMMKRVNFRLDQGTLCGKDPV